MGATKVQSMLGSSLPGFMMPAGSSVDFIARSSSTPRSPTSASSHGAWSSPDGVVVGDGAAGGDDRVAGGGLGRAPLLDLLALRGRAPGT